MLALVTWAMQSLSVSPLDIPPFLSLCCGKEPRCADHTWSGRCDAELHRLCGLLQQEPLPSFPLINWLHCLLIHLVDILGYDLTSPYSFYRSKCSVWDHGGLSSGSHALLLESAFSPRGPPFSNQRTVLETKISVCLLQWRHRLP